MRPEFEGPQPDRLVSSSCSPVFKGNRKTYSRVVGDSAYLLLHSGPVSLLAPKPRDDEEASTQLVANDAQILSQTGDAHEGFYLEYKLGKSIGTLTISPLAQTLLIHRATPLCKGLEDVTAHIEQTEKWFPKEPGTITVRLNDGLR